MNTLVAEVNKTRCFKPSKDRYKHGVAPCYRPNWEVSNPQRIATNAVVDYLDFQEQVMFQTLKGSLQTKTNTWLFRWVPRFKPSKDRYKHDEVQFIRKPETRFQTLKGSLQTDGTVKKIEDYSGFKPSKDRYKQGRHREEDWGLQRFQTLKGSLQTLASPSLSHCFHGFKPSKDRYKLPGPLSFLQIENGFKPSKDRYKQHGTRRRRHYKDVFQTLKGSLQTQIPPNMILPSINCFKPSKDRYKLLNYVRWYTWLIVSNPQRIATNIEKRFRLLWA